MSFFSFVLAAAPILLAVVAVIALRAYYVTWTLGQVLLAAQAFFLCLFAPASTVVITLLILATWLIQSLSLDYYRQPSRSTPFGLGDNHKHG